MGRGGRGLGCSGGASGSSGELSLLESVSELVLLTDFGLADRPVPTLPFPPSKPDFSSSVSRLLFSAACCARRVGRMIRVVALVRLGVTTSSLSDR